MTVLATLSQDGNSVDLPLLEEGGNPVVIVDHSKPNLITHENGGTAFPRTQDRWSGQAQFNLLGYFRGPNAHSDAIDLCELVQSDGGGNPMVLDIPGVGEIGSDIDVSPAAGQKQSVNLNYPNGIKNYVEFDVGLTRIGPTLGSYNRTITTPTDTGSGPIEITDGSTTVELVNDIMVDRYVGRPHDVVRKSNTQYPRYEVKRKIVHDGFELSLMFSSDAVAQTQDLADLFSTRLGRGSLTLDFNGIYGMGAFDVMPDGASGLRHNRESGKQGISVIPSINLVRVHQD